MKVEGRHPFFIDFFPAWLSQQPHEAINHEHDDEPKIRRFFFPATESTT